MITELVKAFILIFIAEMGDKTQILAMAFATRFPVRKVLMGIFIGSFLNHGLAVILGSYISNFIPISTIQIIAGFAFVGFSLWTLKSEDEEDEDEKQKARFGPVLTVAAAFFIGELGDKTQLTAITLATDASYPIAILGGTVLGMIVTGGIGIIIGKKLGDRIPEFAIKLIAASVFMFFGVAKLYQSVPSQYLTVQNISLFAAAAAIIAYAMLRPTLIKRRQGKESAFRRQSRELYNYYHKAERNVEAICLGVDDCGECQGNHCIIGQTKTLIKSGLEENDASESKDFALEEETLNKPYDKEQVLECLRLTLQLIKTDPENAEFNNIHEIRKNLELILFGSSIEQINEWDEYQRSLEAIDKDMASRVLDGI